MKPTSASAPDRPSWIRVATAALIAGIVAAVLAAMAGPAAVAGTAAPHAATNVATAETNEPDMASPAAIATTEDPITLDDIQQLVDDFEASGEITFAGARRMSLMLWFAQHGIDRGTPELAIRALEEFKGQVVPRYVPSPQVREVLIAAADEMIEQLR